MKLFIESSSLAPDYHNYNTETNYMKIGGYWSNSSQGGIFSTHWQNEYYRESYRSWEIVDYETIPAGWNRKCGYIFWSSYDIIMREWSSYEARTDGGWSSSYDTTEHRCNCPQKYGSYRPDTPTASDTNIYTAVCQYNGWIWSNNYSGLWNSSYSTAWVRSNTCPKGWGKYWDAPESKTGPYVQCAQGYVPSGYQKPVYGYVTRYRDAWHNYYCTRLAKS